MMGKSVIAKIRRGLCRLIAMLKGLFRYKMISLFFVVSQLVIYLAIFGALGIYNRAYNKELDKRDGIYKNRITMDIVTIADKDILTHAGLDMAQGNLLAAGRLSFAVAEMGRNNRVEVILKTNEEHPYPIISGRLPGSEPDDQGKRLVVLGRDKLQYTYEKDGIRYITLESESYEVVGVIGSERSDYWDYKIVMNIECVGSNVKRKLIDNGNYTIELSSDKYNLDDAYKEVYSNITSIDKMAVIESKKMNSMGDNYATESLHQENVRVNLLVYIFCIFNCMLLSKFWIIQRSKEIVIRKVCGMSNGQIIKEVATNLVGISIFSLVVFLVVSQTVNILFKTQYVVYTPITLVGVIGAIAIVIVFTMGYPIWKIMRMNPVEILGNGDC